MSLFDWLAGKPSGSVFIKQSSVADKVQEAKGRIAAVDAANREHNKAADFLEVEATRVHGETDSIHSRVDGVLDTL